MTTPAWAQTVNPVPGGHLYTATITTDCHMLDSDSLEPGWLGVHLMAYPDHLGTEPMVAIMPTTWDRPAFSLTPTMARRLATWLDVAADTLDNNTPLPH